MQLRRDSHKQSHQQSSRGAAVGYKCIVCDTTLHGMARGGVARKFGGFQPSETLNPELFFGDQPLHSGGISARETAVPPGGGGVHPSPRSNRGGSARSHRAATPPDERTRALQHGRQPPQKPELMYGSSSSSAQRPASAAAAGPPWGGDGSYARRIPAGGQQGRHRMSARRPASARPDLDQHWGAHGHAQVWGRLPVRCTRVVCVCYVCGASVCACVSDGGLGAQDGERFTPSPPPPAVNEGCAVR